MKGDENIKNRIWIKVQPTISLGMSLSSLPYFKKTVPNENQFFTSILQRTDPHALVGDDGAGGGIHFELRL